MGRHQQSKRASALRARRRQAARVELLEVRQLFSTIYVDGGVVNPTHDGIGWATAYTDLQQALSVAVSGDRIDLAYGAYKPTATADRTISFNLKSGVGLYGGYAGYGAPNPDARDVVANATILSGDIGIVGNVTDNSYHVVSANGLNATTVLDGVTVSGGNANGNNAFQGGGVYCNDGTLTINNCTFTSNGAIGGGGVYFSAATGSISNCTFTGNASYTGNYSGGAIGASQSTVTITGSTFTSNSSGTGGSAISGGNLTIDSCDFSFNSGQGGAVEPNGSLVLNDCTFAGNEARQYGGAITLLHGVNTTISGCTFLQNHAREYGGAIGGYPGGPVSIAGCLFDGNSGSDGGAVRIAAGSSATLTCTNCQFVGNVASGSGGAIRIEPYVGTPPMPTLILDNCTFASNEAIHGGGLSVNGTASAQVTNCILYGDTSPEVDLSSSFDGTTGTAMFSYSLVSGGYTGIGNINANPKFVRSPSSGGDGVWGTADDDYGDPRLQATSPSIDAGSNAAVPSGVTTDLAGNRRIIGPSVDMGAYEYGVTTTVTGTSGNDSYYVRQSADGSALQIWKGTAAVGNLAFNFATATLASCTFDTGLGDDRLTVDASNGLLANIDFPAGGDNDKLFVAGLSASADLNVQPGWLSLGTANIASTNVEGTYLGVTAGTLIKLNSLNVADSLALPAGEQLVLDVSQLAISGSGKLDLNESDLIVRNGDLATITSALKAGFNQAAGGYWNGSTGIVSTAAAADNRFLTTLGVMQKTSSDTFDSQAVNAGDVLVKYTYYGDADLSGKVDGTDYSLIDHGFNAHSTGWQNGDFNYDGKIDGSDYSLIDNAFNMQGSLFAAAPAVGDAIPQSDYVLETRKINQHVASPFSAAAPARPVYDGMVSSSFQFNADSAWQKYINTSDTWSDSGLK
jgi:predicted outer membrane repeat protein